MKLGPEHGAAEIEIVEVASFPRHTDALFFGGAALILAKMAINQRVRGELLLKLL